MTRVVDASLIVAALVDTGADGRWAESELVSGPPAAPHLLLVEVASTLRRAVRDPTVLAELRVLRLHASSISDASSPATIHAVAAIDHQVAEKALSGALVNDHAAVYLRLMTSSSHSRWMQALAVSPRLVLSTRSPIGSVDVNVGIQ
jgi:hypothetical protein